MVDDEVDFLAGKTAEQEQLEVQSLSQAEVHKCMRGFASRFPHLWQAMQALDDSEFLSAEMAMEPEARFALSLCLEVLEDFNLSPVPSPRVDSSIRAERIDDWINSVNKFDWSSLIFLCKDFEKKVKALRSQAKQEKIDFLAHPEAGSW